MATNSKMTEIETMVEVKKLVDQQKVLLTDLTTTSQSSKLAKELFIKGCRGTITEQEREKYIDNFMSGSENDIGKPLFEMSHEEKMQYNVNEYNNGIGTLKGYDCKKCKNKGDYMVVHNNVECLTTCECMEIRKTMYAFEKSGLGNLLELYKFDNYECEEEWQKKVLSKAKEYTKEENNKWFAFLGESGAGKSHICTAISREYILKGYSYKYMSWIDESTEIKQYVTDGIKYKEKLDELNNTEVLYIDDFFKSENSTKPTNADIKLANGILNHRYNRARISKQKCITIISSERTIQQLMDYDKAIAGRIAEMTSGYILQVQGIEKNYRLKGILSL